MGKKIECISETQAYVDIVYDRDTLTRLFGLDPNKCWIRSFVGEDNRFSLRIVLKEDVDIWKK